MQITKWKYVRLSWMMMNLWWWLFSDWPFAFEYHFVRLVWMQQNNTHTRHIWPAPVVICQLLSSIIMSKLKLIFGLCVCRYFCRMWPRNRKKNSWNEIVVFTNSASVLSCVFLSICNSMIWWLKKKESSHSFLPF